MDFVIHPLKGVNDIEFGMPFDTVRKLMSRTFRTFIGGSEELGLAEKFPSEHYEEVGALCYYTKTR